MQKRIRFSTFRVIRMEERSGEEMSWRELGRLNRVVNPQQQVRYLPWRNYIVFSGLTGPHSKYLQNQF
jgi:hypothetical protein